MAIYMWREYVVPADALYFEAWAANSQVNLRKTGSPTDVTIETSTDGITRTDYTFWTGITLSNIWDKLYMRNKSETPTGFSTWSSDRYYFSMSWNISAHWSVNYLLCKNSTNTLLWSYIFYRLFYGLTNLTLPPSLPATTLTERCYNQMFRGCTNLAWIPKLPATTMATNCYEYMFYQCSGIKVSSAQIWSYTQEYRIPTTWTWTTASGWNSNMLANTWWKFTSNPTLDTTYYIHTDTTIV